MKKQINYFIVALFVAFTCFSCGNNDDKALDLVGKWNYNVSHFAFDYSEDKIQLPAGMTVADLIPNLSPIEAMVLGKLTAIPVNQLPGLVLGQLHGQMSAVFQGIEFLSDTQLNLLLKSDGEMITVPATYIVKESIITIIIDKKIIEAAEVDIPETISMHIAVNNNELILYFSKEAIQVVLMSQLSTSTPPAGMTPEALEAYVTDVMNKTKKLELGAILTR